MERLEDVIECVVQEVRRAEKKFPLWPSDPLHALAVLGEEFGELTQAVLQTIYEPVKSDRGAVFGEAIQVAAMALRFLRSVESYSYDPATQHMQE